MLREALRKLSGWNRWSHVVADYYPVDPQSRWGYGKPANPYILAALERDRPNYLRLLADLGEHADLLHAIPFTPTEPHLPYWKNHWFSTLDAASLVTIICSKAPKRYIEIGSGFSTQFARYAIRSAGLSTTITSIDPHPRAEIDVLCDTVLRSPLENCDLSIFDSLDKGDILFFDGSHRSFTNSDATVFFLEVLPRIKPGVFVHIHDIFLPYDYPPEWSMRLYSEQYLLASMLVAARPGFEVLLPGAYVASDPEMRRLLDAALKGRNGTADIPAHYTNSGNTPPTSFWIRTQARA